MGGVLGKKYILETEGNSVNKFITLGAPFFGSPEAVKRMKDGYTVNMAGIDVMMSSAEVNQTIPSVYELAPVNKNYFYYNNNKGYLKFKTYDWSTFSEYTMPERVTIDFSFSRSNEILGNMFRKEYVDQAISYHETLGESPSKYVDFHRFVSDTRPTLGYLIHEQTIIQNKGRYAGVEQRWVTEKVPGDETVPLVGQAPGKEKTYYVDEKHADMAKNLEILSDIDNIIKGQTINTRTYTDKSFLRDSQTISFYVPTYTEIPTSITKGSMRIASTSNDLSYLISSQEDELNLNGETMPLNITITNPDGTKFIMENGELLKIHII